MLPSQQATPAQPIGGWQNPQATSVYSGNEYAAGMQGQHPGGQMWDPNAQAGRTSFVSVPTSFPGQTFVQPSGPAYSTSGTMPGASPIQPPGQGPAGVSSSPHNMPMPGHQPNFQPGGTPPTAQPHYYYQ